MSRRDTGFPLSVRVLIIERAQGCCERCGEAKPGMQVHHRRPRGMGGTRREDSNQASNGLYLCGMCHRVIENNRTQALKLGQLVEQQADPLTAPVLIRGVWCLLDSDGHSYTIPAPLGDKAS